MPKTFLQEVAQKLYDRYGDDVSSLTLVFPSRRARLFFSDALSQIIKRPVWQPHYMSMDDVMREASHYEIGDKVLLLSELYKTYVAHHPSETFDKFYFWGEVLLSDFDLIDKYLIDAEMMFRNICDLKELEADLSYLTEEMRRVIHDFWSHFEIEESLTEEKRKFLSVWLSLWPVYQQFRERIARQGVAYPGMIYRSAVERIQSGEGSPDLNRHYVFIGFNALSECEKRVLKHLERNAECDFFWDYDSYYTEQGVQEAGRFMRENIREYKVKDEITHDNMLSVSKKLQAVSCVSNVVQCKYVNTLLRQISPDLKFDKQTAIVLTDESLLMPLLHSLPEIDGDVNVTMGYPIKQTAAYSFVERLIELQKNCRKTDNGVTFYHVDVANILTHPYITNIVGQRAVQLRDKIVKSRAIRVGEEYFSGEDRLLTMFRPTDGYSALSAYLSEVLDYVANNVTEWSDKSFERACISLIADSIDELGNCLKKCDIEITISIYTSLLRRHLQSLRIPFSGEPLQGLQVMGILETRNLDFKNVIILSMNDDNFPGNLSSGSSFIPYNLRMAYGMPTPEHHESVYAYYFYRLIQRAERVDMIYCSQAEQNSTGEQSRYIYQLDYELPYDIKRINVGVDVTTVEQQDPVVVKDEKVLRALERFCIQSEERPMLSPTAFARYITCPMSFYFASVAGLKSRSELNEDIDSPMFGTILHDAMQRLYKPIENVANPQDFLQRMLDTDVVEKAVVEAINRNYIKNSNIPADSYSGTLLMVKNVITKYITQGIIPYDISHPHFAVMNTEERISYPFPLGDGRDILIGGIADRIDSLDNGMLRVIDYKTGGMSLEISGVESMFNGKAQYPLQTMLYSMVLYRTLHRNVEPALYFARKMKKSTYSPRVIDMARGRYEVDYATYAEEFEEALRAKLLELFNPEIPFTCCENKGKFSPCTYCDYKVICKR